MRPARRSYPARSQDGSNCMTINISKLFIGGEWVAGELGKTGPVIDPATEEKIGEVCHAGPNDLRRAIDAAKDGMNDWLAVPPWDRGGVLIRAAELLRTRQDEIARLITAEHGKPLADSLVEIDRAAGFIEWGGEEARRVASRKFPARDGRSEVTIETVPVGIVAAFTPWNYPVLQASKKLAALLGAGCSCVLKPAEETPASTIKLIETLLDAGLPEKTINVVFGVPADISSFLIADPAIRKITFTGSVPVGKLLAAQAGEYMKPVTMELGGHSPVIVFDDVDVDQTVELLAARKFNNTGQVCVSPTRFFIQRSVYAPFVDKFCEKASAIKVGRGFEAGVTMGPLANDRRLQAIQDLVADAVGKGATIRTGGNRIGNKGYFFEPTVLTNVALDCDLMTTEPFGPVVPILPFDNEEEVLELANASDYGLSGYFFTQDAERQRKFATELEVGTVGINDTPIHVGEIPLGGWKDSGYGVEGGIEMLSAFLKSKFIYNKRP